MWAATQQNQQNGCAPSEDSDQPWHPPSLIGVFPVHMMKAWTLSYLSSEQQRLWSDWAYSDQTGRMPRLIRVFAGRTLILLVLSWGGSCIWFAFTSWVTEEIQQRREEALLQERKFSMLKMFNHKNVILTSEYWAVASMEQVQPGLIKQNKKNV